MSEKPDFEALRAQRNEGVKEEIAALCAKHGWDASKVHHSFDFNACYCDCESGGPCEHDFQGWREFENGRGGEQVCKRCGMGAMSHSMRFLP